MDANDNAPIFIDEPYTWNVTEGMSGIGQTYRIRAHDADSEHNGEIDFQIVQGNEQKLFILQSLSTMEV
jgi:hypothetical protein